MTLEVNDDCELICLGTANTPDCLSDLSEAAAIIPWSDQGKPPTMSRGSDHDHLLLCLDQLGG